MRFTIRALSRVAAAATLLIALGAAAGFAQPKAESTNQQQAGATAAANPAAPGILVFAVQPGSPAEKAGVARGDIILAADATAINTPMDLQRIVAAKKQGDTVSLKLQHGDATKTVSVTLGADGSRLGISIAGGPGMYGGGMGRGMRGFRPGGRFPFTGAWVEGVVAGGPAEKAGLKQGDVILSVDGTAVDAAHALGDLIGSKKVGDTVTLSVSTPGQAARDVKVALEKNPSKDGPYLGVQYSVGPMMPGRGGYGPGMIPGIVIADVAADSPAAKAGIAVRDIITKVDGAAVSDPQQVVDAVGAHKPGDSLTLTLSGMADGTARDVTVTLGASPKDATKAWLGLSMSVMPGMRAFHGPDGQIAPPPSAPPAAPSTPAQNPPTI